MSQLDELTVTKQFTFFLRLMKVSSEHILLKHDTYTWYGCFTPAFLKVVLGLLLSSCND